VTLPDAAPVDEKAGRPVAAAHIAGDIQEQTKIEAGEVDLAEVLLKAYPCCVLLGCGT
jgi:hypothetical protein